LFEQIVTNNFFSCLAGARIVHHLLICVLCRMYDVVCIALLLFDYNGQLLEHAICLVVLFFFHFIVLLLFFERNKWRWRWRDLGHVERFRCVPKFSCTGMNVMVV